MMPAMGLGTGGYGGAGGGGEWWNDTMVPPIITEWLKRGGRRIDTAYVGCHIDKPVVACAWVPVLELASVAHYVAAPNVH